MIRRCVSSIASLLILFASLPVAQAASDVWDGNAAVPPSGVWGTAVNWVDNTTPTGSDTATFNLAQTYTVTFNAAPTAIQALSLNAGNVTFASSGGARTLGVTSATGGQDVTINGGSTLTLGTSGNPLHLTAGDDLIVNGAATLNANFGSQVNTLDLLLAQSGGNGTIVVDGTGSQFNVTNAISAGLNGLTATLTYRNSATGSLGALTLANSGNAASAATLNVESGAMVTSGSLNVGISASAAATGTVDINGSGSTLTLTGASTLTVGGAVGIGDVNISGGGTLNTGTGTTTINAGGRVDISLVASSGILNANGNININGGILVRNPGGTLNIAPGTTMTIQNGGSFLVSSISAYITNANVTYNILTGGSLSAGGGLRIGTLGSNTFTVDGAGSTASGGGSGSSSIWGSNGNTANVTFSNDATGTFGSIALADSSVAGTTANVDILSGADLTLNNSLSLATSGGATTSATLDIQGSGSSLIQTGAVGVTVGHASEGTATINIGTTASGAELETGTGTLTINATGTINVGSGANIGTLDPNGDVTINGGQLNVAQGEDFHIDAGKTMAIQNGGRASFDQIYSTDNAIYNITGAGSTLETVGGSSLHLIGGAQVNILSGGRLSSANVVSIGNVLLSSSTLTVDGAGSTVTAAGAGQNRWGSTGSTATVVFRNQATGTFSGEISLANSTMAGTTANVTIESGADVTAGGLSLATLGGTSTAANLTIDGVGSTVNLNPGTDLTIGHASTGTAIINVEDGGALTVGTGGDTFLNATGTINIDGGSVDLKTLTDNGGAINFTAGSLSYLGNLTVGIGGMLGTDLTLTGTRRLTLDGTTTVDAFHSLTLDGGTLSTGSLVVNGTFAFNSGTLGIIGAGGLTVGSGGQLGSSLNIGAGKTLNVTNTLTVNSGAQLTVSGGNVSAGSIANAGTISLGSLGGTFSVAGSIVNQSSGRLFVGPDASFDTAAITNAGRIQLQGGAARLGGGGGITNNGLITGDGEIAKTVLNDTIGEIRAENGKTLLFSGAAMDNAGEINLLGGIAEFTQPLTNSQTITGRGTLIAPSITNNNDIFFSAGISDVYGSISNSSLGGLIIVSGGGTVSFYDAVDCDSGSELRVSANSIAVFFGNVTGTNFFTGSGTTIFEDGNSAVGAMVMPAGDSVVESPATLTVERFRLDELMVNGLATISANGGEPGMTVVNSLAVNAGGALDLSDNDLVVNNGDFSDIFNLVLAGFGNPSGITSSTSDGTQILALFDNALVGTSDWLGVPIGANAIVGKYTYFGDVNIDGQVTGDDYAVVDSNLDTDPAVGIEWLSGDANLDGIVTGDDYATIDSNLGLGVGNPLSLNAVVPEPGVGLLGAILAGLARRVRRR